MLLANVLALPVVSIALPVLQLSAAALEHATVLSMLHSFKVSSEPLQETFQTG